VFGATKALRRRGFSDRALPVIAIGQLRAIRA